MDVPPAIRRITERAVDLSLFECQYQLVHQKYWRLVPSINLCFPRDVFSQSALSCCIDYFAHNHPSGDPTPSEDDIAFTQMMKKAADLLGIELVDHIVIAKTSWASMKEQGKLI